MIALPLMATETLTVRESLVAALAHVNTLQVAWETNLDTWCEKGGKMDGTGEKMNATLNRLYGKW